MNIFNDETNNRRLADKEKDTIDTGGPSWADFIAVCCLLLLFMILLRFLLYLSNSWKRMMKKRIEAAIKLRELTNDPFRNANGYSWDYAMVFKVNKYDEKKCKTPDPNSERELVKKWEEDKKNSLKGILNKLGEAGLETKLFYSIQNDEVYCKIRCPLKRLMLEADRIDYKLQLETTQVSNLLGRGNNKGPIARHWEPVRIPSYSFETEMGPYDYIYAPYEQYHPSVSILYKKYENNSIFRGVDRLKLISNIIAARLNDGGCQMDTLKLIKDKNILGFFPIHDLVELRELEEKWLRFCQPPWKQHVDSVKDYYGEKIGLYFAWLGHYTTWLIPAAVFGLIAWIVIQARGENDPNTPFMPAFAVYVAIWSSLFIASWKRKEKIIALKWGMIDAEESAQARPEFKGIPSVSSINGSPIIYFPRNEYLFRVAQSSLVISVCILIVITVVASIFVLKLLVLTNEGNKDKIYGGGNGPTTASMLNAIQIQVMNILYGGIAISLNDFENHRTDIQYEDALIAKTFIFQFVNSFAPLFYIAFVKPFIPTLDPCQNLNCLNELQNVLGTIFITRLATGSITAIAVPWIGQILRTKAESKGVSKSNKISDIEKQFLAPEYHVILGTFQDYAEMMIQFGYTTMFITSFPLAAVMAFVSNYVELRVDAWKLCQMFRRTEPRAVEDIGTWITILEVISFASILVNCGLIAFTGTGAENYTWTAKAWIFFLSTIGIVLFRGWITSYIPEMPREVEIQIERSNYVQGKIFENIRDEDPGIFKKIINNTIDYTIRVNDDDPL